jgi:hypothetical protein
LPRSRCCIFVFPFVRRVWFVSFVRSCLLFSGCRASSSAKQTEGSCSAVLCRLLASSKLCPPPALVRRAMSVYLNQKLRMPDLCSARFVVYDCDTDPWWRWTRAGRHFRVTQRVSAQSEQGMRYALPHDVLILESPFGFWTDTTGK